MESLAKQINKSMRDLQSLEKCFFSFRKGIFYIHVHDETLVPDPARVESRRLIWQHGNVCILALLDDNDPRVKAQRKAQLQRELEALDVEE